MKKILTGLVANIFTLALFSVSLAGGAAYAAPESRQTTSDSSVPSSLDAKKELKVGSQSDSSGSSSTRAAQKEANRKADAEYKEARAKCKELKDNAKDVCQAEARAERTRAKAEAEAAAVGTSSSKRKALVDIAKADYEVAKAKCGAKQGDAKDECIKAAKLERAKTTMEPPTQDKAGTMIEPKSQDRAENAGSRSSGSAK